MALTFFSTYQQALGLHHTNTALGVLMAQLLSENQILSEQSIQPALLPLATTAQEESDSETDSNRLMIVFDPPPAQHQETANVQSPQIPLDSVNQETDKVTVLQNELESKKKAIEGLRRTLTTTQKTRTQAHKASNDAKAANNQLTKKLQALEENKAELEQTLTEKKAELDEFKASYTETEKRFHEQSSTVTILQNKVGKLDEEASTGIEETRSLQIELRKTKEEHTTILSKLRSESSQITSRAKADLESKHQQDLQQLKDQHKQTVADLNREKEMLESKVQKLRTAEETFKLKQSLEKTAKEQKVVSLENDILTLKSQRDKKAAYVLHNMLMPL